MEVIDGNNSRSKSIGRFCGFGLYAHPESIRSSGRYMLVRFRSDWISMGYDDGFKVTFTAEDESSKLELLIKIKCFFLIYYVAWCNRKKIDTYLLDARPI